MFLDYIEKSARYIEAAQDKLTKQAQGEREYMSRIPDTVDSLVLSGLVPESNRVKLAEALKEPINALQCLSVLSKQASVGDNSWGKVVDKEESSFSGVGSVWNNFAKSKTGWSM